MRYEIPATTTTVGQITHSVDQCLGRLLQKRQLDEAAQDDFAAVRSMLEAMTLATDLYSLACTRLQNALREAGFDFVHNVVTQAAFVWTDHSNGERQG
jgi:hypothetical protein